MQRTPFSLFIVPRAAFVLFSLPANSQQTPSSPTLIIGTTPVKLGMPRDAVLSVLSSQYIVKPQFPNKNTLVMLPQVQERITRMARLRRDHISGGQRRPTRFRNAARC
jgi:hypothetical protein